MKIILGLAILFCISCLIVWSAEEKAAETVAQKTCPVKGGEINKSLYFDFEGRRIYVCNESCLAEVKKDPQKYIQKIARDGGKVERAPDHIADGVSFIGIDTLKKLLADKNPPLVIDVLPKEHYDKSHIEGAVNIPLKELETRAVSLDKSKKIVVYCASYTCHASTAAAKILTRLGFTDVHDYKGGLKEWQEESKAEKAAACAKCCDASSSGNCCRPKAGCGAGGCSRS